MEVGFGAGFEHPGSGHGGHIGAHVVVVEHVDKLGHGNALIPSLDADGQLVSEEAGCGAAHARHTEVLAQVGHRLHVEVVQRDDAVELARPCQVGTPCG